MFFLVSLGIIDVLCAISMAGIVLGYPLPHLQAISALALIIKGVLFINDVISVIDIAVGIAMFILLWITAPTIALGLAVYLGIKGLMSFA
jgi:hypothetical protein